MSKLTSDMVWFVNKEPVYGLCFTNQPELNLKNRYVALL